jgi:FtsP/CotA-like multicopper oxidase with cupredoxin domain
MKGHNLLKLITLAWAILALVSGFDPGGASAAPVTTPGSVPDYFETPNWANSPPLRKFVDTLAPLGCTTKNNLGQCIPVALPDTSTYPGSDYYEIELVQYREQLHSDLPPVAGNKMTATSGGTLLRGYRQTNTTDTDLLTPHYLGPIILAQKGRPVRIKFTNSLPTGTGGNLFVPVDTSIMGSGPFEINYDPETNLPSATVSGSFAQNRATLHLHGGLNPWISDGTPHQWITPAGETTAYPKGVSVAYVPDMWFDLGGNTITTGGCPGSTTCNEPNATNNPGPGSQTFYYTNDQSARLLFYHDHAWGITRLNVYVGEAAGYLIQDPVEAAMVGGGTVNGRTYAAGTIPADQIPLVIEDKTFVDPTTIAATDPTWAWGSQPWNGTPGAAMTPVLGDLWWPHVYMPAENPYSPDNTGVAPLGRWVYGPWFFPPTPVCGSSPQAVKPFCIDFGPVPNPYYDPNCVPDPSFINNNFFCQPPEIPGTPNVSWGAEAFLDTMTVNGTVYPTVTLDAKEYRLRILNANHDRFVNLQFYVADGNVPVPTDCVAPGCVANTEVRMVPAALTPGFPAGWPTDGREGGVPDPALRGPAMIQIGTEAGFLAAPVLLPNQPVTWNTDVTTFNAGNVLQQNQGGGTLMLGPAERADVIVDFSQFAGQTLILYNDAPAPWPALDPHYDYYTGSPDRTSMGGYTAIPVGRGPNVRTIMQIKVNGVGGSATPDAYNPTTLANLQAAFASTNASPGAFASGQDPIVVGQSTYNTTYNTTFPSVYPYWGISRIGDDFISFNDINGIPITNVQMHRKAIHDEMGGTFDDFGRLSAKLGLEIPFANAAAQTFVLQNYVDPPTEFVKPGEVQIWRFTHNGVDTHPMHFHLFDVQVLNRVGWDGFIRLPDPNEIGWKDTVRISPLEDTIVALRPKLPTAPWPLPDSERPLNPMAPTGSTFGFSQIDINTGGNLATPTTNQIINFGYEYVFHCHILSHEEQDMMRSTVFNIPTAVPPAPVLAAPVTAVQKVTLSWTDSSGTTPNVIDNTTGYIIERDTAGNGFQTIATINYLVLTYDDTTVAPNTRYTYRLRAFNSVGNSPPSGNQTTVTPTWTPPTVALTLPVDGSTYLPGSTISLAADATTPGGSTITKVEFFYGGVIIGLDTSFPYTFDWTNVPAGSYQVTAKVTNSLGAFAVSPANTVNVVGNVLLVTPPATGTNFGVWKVLTTATPPVPMTFTVTNLTGASAGPLTLTPTAPFTLAPGLDSCSGNTLNASAPGNSCTFTVAFTPAVDGVVNGTVTITATGVPDAIANVSGTGDGTQPILTLNPVGTFTNLATPTISGTVSDNIAVASVQVSVNAGAPVTATITPGTPSTWTTPVTLTNLNGLPNAISVIATDTAQPGGNVTAPLTASITHDGILPSVTITSPAPGLTNNPSPVLTYTATDTNLISIAAILDGVTLPSVPAALGPFADGAHTITIDAADAAGNHGTATSNFTVDATPPVVVITSPPAGTVLTASPLLTYTVTDANPNPALTVVRVDGNVVANPVSGMTLGPLAAGVHTLTIDATDLAGNVSPTSSVTFTINLGPALTVTPATVSYSNVAVNLPSSPTGFSIINNGNSGLPLAITGISLSGANTADFQLNNGTCGTAPFNIPVGGSCIFTVTLAPLSTGPKFANVNVTATGETPANILLSGTGVAAVTNPVRSTSPSQTGYPTLTAAFAAATGNATLQAMNAVLPAATLTVNSTGSVNFTGGYDALWGIKSGMTFMQGVMTIQNGSLVVDGLTIQ